MSALGEAAAVSIVTPELAELAVLARARGAAFLPAGAGGGDVAYHVGFEPPHRDFSVRAQSLGLTRVRLAFSARGVHALGPHSAL